MKRAGAMLFLAAAGLLISSSAPAAEVTYRLDLDDPRAYVAGSTETLGEAVLPLAEPAGGVEVSARVTIVSAIESCISNLAQCDGGEAQLPPPSGSAPAYGCGDTVDNDGDGLTDLDDPDCLGVQGWSISVATDSCFGIRSATTRGTLGDLESQPPGLRDPEGSFESTQVASLSSTGGRFEGAVSSVVLSFNNPVILPPSGEAVVLKLGGIMSTGGLAPGMPSEPCFLRFQATDGSGASLGEGVRNRVIIDGETVIPAVRDLSVQLLLETPPEAALRADVVEPDAARGDERRVAADQGVVPWQVTSTAGAAELPVEAAVALESRVEPCASDPQVCNGTENFQETAGDGSIHYGCTDGIDNDGNGLTDLDDPDCRGVQGWSIVMAVDACFGLVGATTLDTLADLDTRPPGRRDSSERGSFHQTEIFDPLEPRSPGQRGVLSAVVLSLTKPVFLPQVGDSVVLRLSGAMDVPREAGASGDPCLLEIVPPSQEFRLEAEGGGAHEEPRTAIIITGGETVFPFVRSAEVRVTNREAEFLRGDTNSDGTADMSDPITTLNYLFLGGRISDCMDAIDADDSGRINLADAIFELSFLFLNGAAIPAPGNRRCGPDPTTDSLGCSTSETACAP